MTGAQARKCIGGSWDGVKPTCFGLNQENDYASKYHLDILLILFCKYFAPFQYSK
jgi:hypothetical protein